MLNLRTYQNQTKKSIMQHAEKFGVYSLLAKPDANPKVAKNAKDNALTAPLHLAPHKLSGFNVCASATAGCAAACLHSAGNPAYMAQKEKSRIARTQLYFGNRALFIEILRREIKLHIKRAGKLGMQAAIRLNATSDIRWENVLYHLGDRQGLTLFHEFPNVQFYDYTKHANRRKIPANYHLTFSLAEDNHAQALEAIERGLNVAVVFDTARGRDLPESLTIDVRGKGKVTLPVFDGDVSDYRPADQSGFIGLRAKGEARKDKSGFVNSGFGKHATINVLNMTPFEFVGGHWPSNQKGIDSRAEIN